MNSDYLVGKTIGGRYEITEKIGTGGMATVYKAKCRVLDRFVAIKVLKDSLKFDTEVVKRFNTESRAAAGLSHPNIVQVYDVGECDGLDYIVMELVDGITLKEYIMKNGRIPWRKACEFAAQIGRALECAHDNNVVHRDIKPHNVLITRDGCLKVADFGIAQASSSETMIAGGSAMGSVHYISPEQARGGYTNERSDIYSLGVVLYEMLTGTVPFDGANPVSIAIMKLEKEPRDCRIINPDIPDNIAEITMKAISKEQHSRYQSAGAMVKELEAAMGAPSLSGNESADAFETKRLSVDEAREELGRRREKRHKEDARKKKLAAGGVLVAVLLALITYFSMTGGKQEYQVPDLTNMTVEEAEEALEAAELKLDEDIEFESSEEVVEGLVIRQKPGINQYVKKNRKIKITVSSGLTDGEVNVPDVENLLYEEAKKRLEKEGFKCKRVDEYSETVEFEYVIRQSPKSGTKANEGYTVLVYVSADVENPNEKISVPSITGLSQDAAELALSRAGLAVGTVTQRESTSAAGTVIEQSPASGGKLEKNGKVNMVISGGQSVPQQTPPPAATATATPVPEMKKKTLTITIPGGETESVHIRAVANGKEIYGKTHLRSEGTVDIPVQSSKDASVQVYIDGELVADKVITFD